MADDRVGFVTLKNVRLSYPHLWKPQDGMLGDDGKLQPGKFGAQLIIDPETPHGKLSLKKLKAAKEAVILEQWGAKPPPLGAAKLCTKKYAPPVDEEGDIDEENVDPAYVDKYFVSARNKDQPSIVDINKDDEGKWRRLKESDGKPYGGCYVNAVVRLWAQDNGYGKRVNAALEVVQYYRKGEAFGAGPVNPDDLLDDSLSEGGDLDQLEDFGEDGGDPAGSAGADGDGLV